MSFQKKSDSTKIIIYRFCEHWTEVMNLKSNLSGEELLELTKNENATLNIIGLIYKLEKNNKKEYAIRLIQNLIDSEKKFIGYGCSDAITSRPIEQFFLYLITEKNLLFEPDFDLNESEVDRIERKILVSYERFWRN